MNVEELLRELIKFSRKCTDQVKVDKMTAVVARLISNEIAHTSDQARYRYMLDTLEEGGHT